MGSAKWQGMEHQGTDCRSGRSDVRNGTRQPANISSKNGAMSASIHNHRVPITGPFGKASTKAMTSIHS
jgi:hypothetical protein